MKKVTTTAAILLLSLTASVTVSAAPLYQYVGLFTTDGYAEDASGTQIAATNSAPLRQTFPQVFSGLEAAVFVFGGVESDYQLSTELGVVNGLAWYDGWGEHSGLQEVDSYKLDMTGLGYNGCEIVALTIQECTGSAFSAYIQDGFSGTNYVFRAADISDVPLPKTSWLLLTAVLGGAGLKRRKSD